MKKEYTEVEKLQRAVDIIHRKIKVIQIECNHPKEMVVSKHEANTDNYDPTSDCYWVSHHCTLCDNRWTEDLTYGIDIHKFSDNEIVFMKKNGYKQTKEFLETIYRLVENSS